MIENGREYSYITNREAFILLRARENDLITKSFRPGFNESPGDFFVLTLNSQAVEGLG